MGNRRCLGVKDRGCTVPTSPRHPGPFSLRVSREDTISSSGDGLMTGESVSTLLSEKSSSLLTTDLEPQTPTVRRLRRHLYT